MIEKAKRPTRATKVIASAVPDAVATEIKASRITKVMIVAPAVPAGEMSKGEKHKKLKMVRDSFTLPASDHARIAALKMRCIKAGVSAKKSEVLRAALACLASLSDMELIKAITDLEVIKTGRPAKG